MRAPNPWPRLVDFPIAVDSVLLGAARCSANHNWKRRFVMAANVKAIPNGYHTITPNLTVREAAKAIDFYKKAFGAEEIMRMAGPGGRGIMHAELRIGNSPIML